MKTGELTSQSTGFQIDVLNRMQTMAHSVITRECSRACSPVVNSHALFFTHTQTSNSGGGCTITLERHWYRSIEALE